MRDHTVSGLHLVWMATGALIVVTIIAVLIALTVKFGREMGGYLETSTGLDRARVTTVDPSVRPQPAPPRTEPAVSVPETPVLDRSDDAAELRSTTVAVDPP